MFQITRWDGGVSAVCWLSESTSGPVSTWMADRLRAGINHLCRLWNQPSIAPGPVKWGPAAVRKAKAWLTQFTDKRVDNGYAGKLWNSFSTTRVIRGRFYGRFGFPVMFAVSSVRTFGGNTSVPCGWNAVAAVSLRTVCVAVVDGLVVLVSVLVVVCLLVVIVPIIVVYVLRRYA